MVNENKEKTADANEGTELIKFESKDGDVLIPDDQDDSVLEVDSEGNEINDEDKEDITDEEEQRQIEKENEFYRIMDEYEPHQVLDMINYHNYHTNKERDDKEIQTDKVERKLLIQSQVSSNTNLDNVEEVGEGKGKGKKRDEG